MTAKATLSTMAQPLTKKDRYILALIDLCSDVPTSMFAKFDAKAFLKRHDVHPDFLMTLLERGYLFEKEGEYKQGVELRRVQSKEMIDWCEVGEKKPSVEKKPASTKPAIKKPDINWFKPSDEMPSTTYTDTTKPPGESTSLADVSEPAILPIFTEAKVVNIPDEVIDLLSTDMEPVPIRDPAIYYVKSDKSCELSLVKSEEAAMAMAKVLSREGATVTIFKSFATVECIHNYKITPVA